MDVAVVPVAAPPAPAASASASASASAMGMLTPTSNSQASVEDDESQRPPPRKSSLSNLQAAAAAQFSTPVPHLPPQPPIAPHTSAHPTPSPSSPSPATAATLANTSPATNPTPPHTPPTQQQPLANPPQPPFQPQPPLPQHHAHHAPHPQQPIATTCTTAAPATPAPAPRRTRSRRGTADSSTATSSVHTPGGHPPSSRVSLGRSNSALPGTNVTFHPAALANLPSTMSASFPAGGGGSAPAPAPQSAHPHAYHQLPARTSSIVRRHTVNANDPGMMPDPSTYLILPASASQPSPLHIQTSVLPPSPTHAHTGSSPSVSAAPASPTAAATGAQPTASNAAGTAGHDLQRRRTISRNFGAKKIDKNHEKYAFMYHMLTGIRLSVSRCETKDDRDLLPDDFRAQHKLTSDVTGAELDSSQGYDFKFKDYCPMVFRKIRAAFGLTAPDYLNSLTGKYILSELFSPGKSKSYLYYSHDYRYIIKTIHPAEQKRLLKILPQYVDYVTKNPNTLLARYYGLHRVKMPKQDPVHFVVMANVFPPNYDIHLTFDLKGSTVGREISPEELAKKGKKAVLKDLNWLNMNRKLMLGPEKAKLFCDQLERDMLFLMAKNIMDYSLLIGIHDLSKGNADGTSPPTAGGLGASLTGLSTAAAAAGAGGPATSTPMGGGPSPLAAGSSSTGAATAAPQALQVFEPNRMTLQRTLPTTPRADTMRKALQQPEITRLDTISALHLEPADAHRSRSVFFADQGGLRATDAHNRPLNELYFMSIIDILTPYNAAKKLEHAFKVVTQPGDRKQISAVKPADYGRRFVGFMKGLVGTVTGGGSDGGPPGPQPQPSQLLPSSGSVGNTLAHPVAVAPRTAPIGEEAEETSAAASVGGSLDAMNHSAGANQPSSAGPRPTT